ncbi:MAG: SDR family NAD(P)-dependent oxidoreductase [Myxococcota bacterium]
MRVAIVTGASSGLGWEYAKQLAPRKEVDEVWLIARRRDRLEELATHLVGAEGRPFSVDLTDEEQLAGLFDRLEREEPEITWLVNNAGFGKYGLFDDFSVDTNLRMIDLNIRALTEITQRALPYCRPGSRILQVASSAGFAPLAKFAVYAATKAYVLNFSNALAAELADRDIGVTAVCPGPVDTEFQAVAEAPGGDDLPVTLSARAPDVVRHSIADARKGRYNSVYGASMSAWQALSGIVPRRVTTWVTNNASI